MNNTYFIFDVDGVLLDWVKGFDAWIPQFVFDEHNPNKGEGDESSYCLGDRYKFDPKTMNQYVRLFNDSTAFQNLPPIDGADQFLDEVYDVSNIAVLTSFYDASLNQDSIDAQTRARIRNLRVSLSMEVGDYKPYWLPLGSDKYDTLIKAREYALDGGYDEVVFIDDKPAHVLEGVKAGLTSHLLLQPYNMKHEIADEYGMTWNALLEKYKNDK